MSQEITDANFNNTINSNRIVVVDFWATWCGPCRAIAPIIEELSNEFKGKAIIGKLNVDINPNTTTQFGIRHVPAILFFKDGQLVGKHSGPFTKSMLTAKINSYL